MKRNAAIVIFVIGTLAASTRAQTQPHENFQSRNDILLTLPDYFDISTSVRMTFPGDLNVPGEPRKIRM